MLILLLKNDSNAFLQKEIIVDLKSNNPADTEVTPVDVSQNSGIQR